MIKFDRRYLPLNALRAFEMTGKSLSFTAAADKLGVTQSAISRQILHLEDLLGLSLLNRQQRAITLTEAGQELLNATSPSFDSLERKLNELIDKDKRGLLKISVATSFAHRTVPALITEFIKKYPWLNLDVESPRNVTDLDNTDYDIAIVFSKPKVTSHIMDLLWKEELTLLCSAKLLIDDAKPDPAEFISKHAMLHVKTEAGPYFAWEYWAKSAGLMSLNSHSGLILDTSQLAVRFAIDGGGMVVCDKRLYQNEIDNGSLCAPFNHVCESGFGYYMMFRKDDLTNENVQLFRNWVIDHFVQSSARAPHLGNA